MVTYIGGIADELSKEDLFVAVKGVDDETEELIDLSLEWKRLCFRHYSKQRKLRKEETNRFLRLG